MYLCVRSPDRIARVAKETSLPMREVLETKRLAKALLTVVHTKRGAAASLLLQLFSVFQVGNAKSMPSSDSFSYG